MQLLNKTEQNAYPEGKSKLVKEMAVLTVPDLTLKRAGGGGGAGGQMDPRKFFQPKI